MTAVSRAVWFLGLWFVLAGLHSADLPGVIVAVAAATWASLRLLPPGSSRPSATAIAGLALRFVQQSVIAGADIAWRALNPRLPLRPGFVVYEVGLPPGPARSAFCTLTSLLPGTLPAWPDDNGNIVIHCLDVDEPVAAQMAEEEKLFVRALEGKPGDD